MNCDGNCLPCLGDLVKVKVYSEIGSFEFTYCQVAIEKDNNNGLDVEVLAN